MYKASTCAARYTILVLWILKQFAIVAEVEQSRKKYAIASIFNSIIRISSFYRSITIANLIIHWTGKLLRSLQGLETLCFAQDLPTVQDWHCAWWKPVSHFCLLMYILTFWETRDVWPKHNALSLSLKWQSNLKRRVFWS